MNDMSVILESYTILDFTIATESAMDRVKSIFDRILTALKNAIDRFSNLLKKIKSTKAKTDSNSKEAEFSPDDKRIYDDLMGTLNNSYNITDRQVVKVTNIANHLFKYLDAKQYYEKDVFDPVSAAIDDLEINEIEINLTPERHKVFRKFSMISNAPMIVLTGMKSKFDALYNNIDALFNKIITRTITDRSSTAPEYYRYGLQLLSRLSHKCLIAVRNAVRLVEVANQLASDTL